MTDTHDTNLPEKQVELEEAKTTAADTTEQNLAEIPAEETDKEEQKEQPAQKLTKEEILARLKEIAAHVEATNKADIDSLKQAYYKAHNSEVEAAKKQFIDNGGDEENFIPPTDPTEEEYKNIMSVIKEKRNEMAAELEKQKEMNLQVKLSIIEELKDLIESPEDPNKNYAEFKKLQQQWNETTLIPATKANELWKNYQLYVEKFYDLLKLNNEFREYDFRKNLEIKQRLCEAAEKLADEPDAVSAYHQWQKLDKEFRETGPVSKEQRDEIWARFKAASSAVHKRHQQHYEALKAEEQNNLDQKTVICEIIEAIDCEVMTSPLQWEEKAQEVIALQAKWKTIGFAPQRMNTAIYERFHKACDDFFHKRTAFFKELKERMSQNLEKKKALCEKAEALKDSTDWKTTSETLTNLQKEWKAIGPVNKRYSNDIWKRFITACDYFFEQRNQALSAQRGQEQENLQKKKEIVEKLEALDTETDSEEAARVLKEYMKEWNATGYVPIKEKDKLQKRYRAAVDKLFDRLNLSAAQKKLTTFRTTLGAMAESGNQLYRERERLTRICENMKNELMTYENNLGFLTTTSKKGNSLLDELHRKAEKLRNDIELTKQKIKAIDEAIKKEGEEGKEA